MDQGAIVTTQELDPERQVRAKIFARINRRLMLVDLAINGAYFLAWLVFGWVDTLKEWLMDYTTNEWLLIPLFVLVLVGILFIFTLPLSYYQGFILPHRYELSNQTLRGWAVDQVKGLVVGGIIGLIVLEIIYLVLRTYPDSWWLWAAGILLVFNVILANIAPTILMPIFNKFVPLGMEYRELSNRLMELAKRSGTQVRGVYQFDMSRRTKQANAGLTGLGNTRRIILGDTLIREFSTEEIETIMAHELGHQVNKDIPLGIMFGSLTTLAGFFLAAQVLEWAVEYLAFSGPGDIAAFPLFVLVLGMYGLITMPLENGFSRWRERRADEYALNLTHNGAAYSSALKRLANQNLADTEPEAWVEWLLYSHPALGKRIAMAEMHVGIKM